MRLHLLWTRLALASLCLSPSVPASAASVLIYGRGEDSKKLDPADVTDGESVKVAVNVFDTLITYAEESAELRPGLALKWEGSRDGLNWIFHLRPGVRFHDDTPFNAEAVLFTFQRLLDAENPYRFGGAFAYSPSYQMIESVRAVDDLTVEFRLKYPAVVFLPNLAMFPASIVSPEAVKRWSKDFFRQPVGTGPFIFQTWTPHEKLVLKANPGYWDGKPGVERLIFKPVKENTARALQLENGVIHLMDGIDFADVDRLKQAAGVIVQTAPGMNLAYLALNCETRPFDDARVRRAIAHAVHKPRILKLAYHGYGQAGVNPLPPTVWGYHAGIEDWPYDPARGRTLLQEAGLAAGFKSQLWAMPNPRPYMPQPKQVAQVIKEGLKEIGVQVEIVSYDWNQYLDRVANGEHPMCLLGWTTDNGDPDNFLYELLDRDKAVKGSANNVCFYRNDRLHELLVGAQREFDPEKRRQGYLQAQEIIHQDVPMIPLAYLPLVAAHSTRVKGFRLHPTGVLRLHRVRLEDE
ncbi:MAG: ABC transporter substrate-binding protein [Planctomycetes bacterium]|nr:ABC transporter substrate-binding protein [Planctomycetota bacterium]